MKILAIDPGTKESGYVIWDGKNFLQFAKIRNIDLIEIIRNSAIDICLIEKFQNYGNSFSAGSSVFEACRWSGRFEQICVDKKIRHAFIPRKTVVSYLTGAATSGDSKVRKAVLTRYPKGTKNTKGITYSMKADCWQAFALAIYFKETNKL